MNAASYSSDTGYSVLSNRPLFRLVLVCSGEMLLNSVACWEVLESILPVPAQIRLPRGNELKTDPKGLPADDDEKYL